MLLHLIISLYIYLANARTNRKQGKYDALWLVQINPISAYFKNHHVLPNTNMKGDRCGLPASACETLFEPSHWVIHGFWPCQIKGSSPIYCRSYAPPYNDSLVESDLRKKLLRNWPSYMASLPVNSRWEYEWDKHGTCSTDRPFLKTLVMYFETVLEIADEYNLGKIFAEYDIHPGNLYSLDRIVNTMIEHFGVRPYVRCFIDQSSDVEEQYLLEVGICFNKTMEFAHCERANLEGPECKINMDVWYPTIEIVEDDSVEISESKQGKYDALWLVQKNPITAYFELHHVWPNTNMKGDKCGLPASVCKTLFEPSHWVVHGFWPCKMNGSSPLYCYSFASKYNDSLVMPDLRNRLSRNWPSYLLKEDVEGLWEYQWNKHGTCSTDLPFLKTLVMYFEKVLEITDEYNVGKIFAEHDIHPGYLYSLDRIVNTMVGHFGVQPYVRCYIDQSSDVEEQYLLDVGICFNKTMHFINCKRSTLEGPICKSNLDVWYPTILIAEDDLDENSD